MAVTLLEKNEKAARTLEVRLAENQLEIERALSLRYNVFNEELKEGLPESAATGKDRDEYDYHCHHLIVLDKERDLVVGTYRILRRDTAAANIGFYSETEFNMKKIYELKDNLAEVGRSCVHPEYRDGSVISLLWAGLAEYMKDYNLRYLFGCGSIHSLDPVTASEVFAYLRKNNALGDERFDIKPLDTHILEGFDPDYEISDDKAVSKRIPVIIKGYVRLGAKICGAPAVDRVFGTTDMFVLFDFEQISAKYGKKFVS